MKLLVTGGAGFIGANFVRYWLKNHSTDQIIVLDKLSYAGNLENLAGLEEQYHFVQGDITDIKTVDQIMTGVDCVVHFAAESHVDRSIVDPFIFTHNNITGTHVLLEMARKHNITRFHHISTDEVFGDIPLNEDWKFTETTPYRPNSPYAASKASSDHLVRAYGATYKLPFTISNCSNNYGPYQYPEKFIPRSIIRLLNNQNIRLYTPGDQVRDWLYVEDHCRAIELILLQGQIGETYCIGGLSSGISNQEVAKMILDILNLSHDKIELVTNRPGHDAKYDINWSKINQNLNWAPQRNFLDRLQQTVKWYQNNQEWWQQSFFNSEQFYQRSKEQLI
jgi:dTDP-glucose 4,6-dehydratase